MFHIRKQDNMMNEYIAYPKRVSVYAQGKRAFDEHKNRRYNPYAAINLAFAISWWHGWDTAEEESRVKGSPLDKHPVKAKP
jgi:hypothetical protein